LDARRSWDFTEEIVVTIRHHCKSESLRKSVNAELREDDAALQCVAGLFGDGDHSARLIDCPNPSLDDSLYRKVGEVLLAQTMVRELVSQLLRVVDMLRNICSRKSTSA